MLAYMTASEAAEKWCISHRRVITLCQENRIPDVAMLGNMWIIPIDAEKPSDARKNNGASKKDDAHPFVKWAGGKGQLLETLKSNLPRDIDTIKKYAEPFVGGGAFLFSLISEYRFEEILISDNNKELMNTYRVIKNNCNRLINSLNTLQSEYNSLDKDLQEQYYYEKRDLFNTLLLNEETEIEKASLFIFLNKTCFNGLYRVNKKGKYNVPFGKRQEISIYDAENLTRISELLQNVTVRECDYHEIEDFIDSTSFVYFDPPYRPLNQSSGFTSYTEDQFSDKNQIELADFYKKLSKKGAKLMLSNSDPKNTNENDSFFDDLYCDFNILRVQASRMINSNGKGRGKINELLIKNY